MNGEYRLEINPNGNNAVQVVLKGHGQPAAGGKFQRQLPALDRMQLESFRLGEVKPSDVEALSESVSAWLLGNDLRQTMKMLMTAPDPLRLVFTIDSSLQTQFIDVPIELLRVDPGSEHLVVHTHVTGLLHLLPNVGGSAGSAATLGWPVRILLVRSNPGDLGGRVPPAAPIRDAILASGEAEFGQGMVKVDLLSREAGALAAPTWEEFMTRVKSEYHILVYLGHGDVQQLHEDLPPLSSLQFETGDPSVHEPVTSRQLAVVLHQNPIPVVVLAGCLTAAEPGTSPLSNLSAWMRGNQGVAQALVNSESGVTFAVGMRSKIDATEAVSFLEAFFRSLFRSPTHKGNVEFAVRAARQEMFAKKPHPPNWAAPVAFTSLAPEPVFEYLTRPIRFQVTEKLLLNLDARQTLLWPQLADQPPRDRRASLTTATAQNREAIRAEVLAHGAMLLPELLDAQPGGTAVLSVTLEGTLVCGQLQAKLSVAPGVEFVKARGTKLLSDAGFQMLNVFEETGVFQIQLKPGAGPRALPGGTILEIDLQVTAEARGICPVSLEVVATDCIQPFWPGSTAVIVTAV